MGGLGLRWRLKREILAVSAGEGKRKRSAEREMWSAECVEGRQRSRKP
jgi:hypothetical protein